MASKLPVLGTALGVALLVGLSTAGTASAATFVVKNTNDAGPGSLRAAIDAANATAAADTIKFNIPGAGGHVITLASPLPQIVHPVTINGQSQPGFAGQPLVRLDNGTGSNVNVLGLDVTAGSTRVLGLSITGFSTEIRFQTGSGSTVSGCWLGLDLAGAAVDSGSGVVIVDSKSNTVGGTSAAARNVISGGALAPGITIAGASNGTKVEGNYIGTDVAGQAPVPNFGGITVSGPGNTIGGTSAGARNVISGNIQDGVALDGASGNTVEGNYIGLGASGERALANGEGVSLLNGASGNTIGGTSAGARNVVSANGIGLQLLLAASNVVEGNYIGTDPAGTFSFPNGTGVQITQGAGNTIGGAGPGAGNLISGNRGGTGISISKGAGQIVQGNLIGLDATGAGILRNNQGVLVLGGTDHVIGGTAPGAGNVIAGSIGDGVDIQDGASGVQVQGNRIGLAATGGAVLGNGGTGVAVRGASNTAIGAVGAGANTIAGSVLQGILVDAQSGAATGNAIRGNSIYDNSTGIELANGANHDQDTPAIVSVTTAAGQTTVVTQFPASEGVHYAVDVFANPACGPEGRQFLATKTFSAKTSGNPKVKLTVPALPTDRGLTATLTNTTTGDTSQFSACVPAP